MARAVQAVVLLAVVAALPACASEPELELPPPRYEERERALAVVREKLAALDGADAPVAIELLAHEDHRVRRAAAQRLGEIGRSAGIDASPDGGVADAPDAGDAGAELADAVEPLIERLDDEHPRVRSAVAIALADIGDPRALDPLVAKLVDPDRFVRLWAGKALKRFGDPAIPVMIAHTSSKSPLRNRGYKDEAGNRQTIRAPLRERLAALGKAVVPRLREALDDEQRDGWIRINAAIIVGMIGSDAAEALPELLANVDTQNARLRLEIVRSLGHIGDLDPEVVPTLKRLGKDRNRKISGAARAAVKEIEKAAKDKAAKERKKHDRKEKLRPRPAAGADQEDDKSGRPRSGVAPPEGAVELDPSGAVPGAAGKIDRLSGQQQAPKKQD